MVLERDMKTEKKLLRKKKNDKKKKKNKNKNKNTM
jgi:hypothetical protein